MTDVKLSITTRRAPEQLMSPDETKISFAGGEIERLRGLFNAYANVDAKPVMHTAVYVLLFSWSMNYNDLEVQPEVDRLKEVFETDYGFAVEEKRLDWEDRPAAYMQKCLGEFVYEHGNEPEALLIIYYAGHGWYIDGEGHLYLLPKRMNVDEVLENKHNTIAWREAEKSLSIATQDILLIFDCCDAGGLAHARSTRKAFEFLGACDKDQETLSPGPKSFTTALIHALQALKHEAVFSTTQLRQAIIEDPTFSQLLNEQQPVLFPRRGDDGQIWIDKQNKKSLAANRHIGEHNEPDREHVDIRFHFNRKIVDADITQIGKALNQLAHTRTSKIAARTFSLLDIEKSISWNAVLNHPHWGRTAKLHRPSIDSGVTFTAEPNTPLSEAVREIPVVALIPAENVHATETQPLLSAIPARAVLVERVTAQLSTRKQRQGWTLFGLRKHIVDVMRLMWDGMRRLFRRSTSHESDGTV